MLERSEGPVEGGSGELFMIKGGAITCCLCGHTSTNPSDIHNRFCPNCLTFFDDHTLMLRLNEGLRKRFEPRDADWHRLKAA
jgi:hypothetical protein